MPILAIYNHPNTRPDSSTLSPGSRGWGTSKGEAQFYTAYEENHNFQVVTWRRVLGLGLSVGLGLGMRVGLGLGLGMGLRNAKGTTHI